MKKLGLNILIVIGIILILDFAVGRTLRHFYFSESSGLLYRTTFSFDKTNADILIFGSSRANHHYVPKVFEDSLKMTYYNTGRDGNFIFFQLALLKSILTRYTPKVIILDYVGTFEKDKDSYDRLSSLLPYYKANKEIRDVIKLKSPFESIKLLSEIYPFNSLLLTIAIGNSESNKRRKHDDKGYVALTEEWQRGIDSIATYSTYKIDYNKLSAFQEFLDISKKAGIKLFVVYSPVFKIFNKNQEVEICRQTCYKKNIPFWDFSKEREFLENRRLFQDPEHLNQNGAVIFSRRIVNNINRIIKIQNHREYSSLCP